MIFMLLLLSVQQTTCDPCVKAERFVKALRCHSCSAKEAACEVCEKRVSGLEKSFACSDDCKKLAREKCVPCAVQKHLVARIWCGDACKVAAKACAQCSELRESVLNIVCAACVAKRTVKVKGFSVSVEVGESVAPGRIRFKVSVAPHTDEKARNVYGHVRLLDADLQPVGGGTISVPEAAPAGGSGTVNAKHLKDGEPVAWSFYQVSVNVVGKPLEK